MRRLLAAQLPRWASLPVEAVPSWGTDNALYRLGDAMVVRMPRIDRAAAQVDKEHRWLPALAPHLSLDVPDPLAIGEPGEGYPWPWSVYRWVDGEEASSATLSDVVQAAVDLARFVTELGAVDATGGPGPGPHNFWRGVPLVQRDEATRAAIAGLGGRFDVEELLAAWNAALAAPPLDDPPAWVHGDLWPGNLLARGGRLAAVVDFGGLAVADPAVDLLMAWSFFDGDSRAAFRSGLGVDDATWERGKGWALSTAVIALPYYRDTNPAIVANAVRSIDAVLAERRPG